MLAKVGLLQANLKDLKEGDGFKDMEKAAPFEVNGEVKDVMTLAFSDECKLRLTTLRRWSAQNIDIFHFLTCLRASGMCGGRTRHRSI